MAIAAMRKQGHNWIWDSAAETMLRDLVATGVTWHECSRILGPARAVIQRRATALGLRDPRVRRPSGVNGAERLPAIPAMRTHEAPPERCPGCGARMHVGMWLRTEDKDVLACWCGERVYLARPTAGPAANRRRR